MMTENKKNDIKEQAPDGGWGWFVCLGSSLITVNISRVIIILTLCYTKFKLLIHI